MGASVKVMRSYDYCHFEVALSTDETLTDAQVNELRKRAARLVDKAVYQYQIAKSVKMTFHPGAAINDLLAAADKLDKPESELTPAEKATLKLAKDHDWRNYDYQDEWDDDFDQSL